MSHCFVSSYIHVSNRRMGRRKSFTCRKHVGKELNKHHGVNEMHGWFQKLLKSRGSVSAQEQKVTKHPTPSVGSSTASLLSSSASSSWSSSPSLGKEEPLSQSALSSRLRWSRQYDVFVCHSSADGDSEEAARLVSFLEASPRSFRCFLRGRDDSPGGAISTELCQALQNSHLWALFITPDFLQDDWCKYMMHQALAEGPMSNRIIPLVQNLSRSECPQELRFFFCIDLSRDPDRGYARLSRTVLVYLNGLAEKEKTLDSHVDSSNSDGLNEESSKTDLMSEHEPTQTSSVN